MSKLNNRVEKLEEAHNPQPSAAEEREVRELFENYKAGLKRAYGDQWEVMHNQIIQQADALPGDVDLIALMMLGPKDCAMVEPKLTLGKLRRLGLVELH